LHETPYSPAIDCQTGKVWQKIACKLIRYVPSGQYYARLRLNGKLIWQSLETDVRTLDELRLFDF